MKLTHHHRYRYSSEQDVHPSMWTTTMRILVSSVPIDILKTIAVVDTCAAPFNQKNGGVVQALTHGYDRDVRDANVIG